MRGVFVLNMEELKRIDRQTPNGEELNLEALYKIVPSCFTEAKGDDGEIHRVVDLNKLRQLLGDKAVEDAPEVYDFTWVGKRAALQEAAAPINKTLRPCPEESVDWDKTQNLYIEGDNLEVLKLLQNSYMGKVKMIYIDPPYNTGNDFIYMDKRNMTECEYEDEIKDEEGRRLIKNTYANGSFHSAWCSEIYKPLMIARNLLSADGVIFISIDDHEIENLKKICCEIFGGTNFIGTLSVENNPKGRKNSDFISVSSEFCLIFAKNKTKSKFIENIPKKASDMTLDEDGRYVHNSGKRVLVGENNFNDIVTNANSDKNYSVYFNKETWSMKLLKEEYGEECKDLLNGGYVKYYSHNANKLVENTYSAIKFKELFEQKALDFSQDKIYEKNFSDTIRIKSILVNREYEAIVHGKKTNFSLELTTTGAGTYIKDLFETKDVPFTAPKNIGFLKLLISLFADKEMTILDFFSGSATTADAMMRLNESDDGHRKYIMVQIPEDLDKNLKSADTLTKKSVKTAINICDKIHKPHLLTELAKERIRRAGKKIKEENPLTTQDLDIGFRVFKCDSSNYKDVAFAPKDYNQGMLEELLDNIKEDRTDLDLLFDCMLRWGVELSLPLSTAKVDGCTIHNVNDGDLVACFDGNVTEAVIDAIASLSPLRVVFRDSSFNEAAQKMNLFELFKQKCDWTDEEAKNNVRVI